MLIVNLFARHYSKTFTYTIPLNPLDYTVRQVLISSFLLQHREAT